MCNEYGFDGVDMDWEHPRVDGPSKDQYQALILYLSDALHAQGKLPVSYTHLDVYKRQIYNYGCFQCIRYVGSNFPFASI